MKMSHQLRPLVVLIVLFGSLFYIGAIIWAGVASLNAAKDNPAAIPEIVTYVITAIGTALATHFGALFGISQFTGGNPRPIPKPYHVNVWATLPRRSVAQTGAPQAGEVLGIVTSAPEHHFDGFQIAAAYVYFGSLVLAAVFWFMTGFSAFAAEVVRNMTFSLIGVIAGVMAIVLNVKKPEK